MSAGPRYVNMSIPPVMCEDCGVMVASEVNHTRFHAILSAHALAIAILKTSHVGPTVHDKYDVDERIQAREKAHGL